MKILLIALLSLISTITFAQTIVNWVGGTPGNENSWNEPKNWSNNRLPNEFSFVTIKATNSGHFAQPEIKGHIEVACIEVQSGASLTIKENAEILIDG